MTCLCTEIARKAVIIVTLLHTWEYIMGRSILITYAEYSFMSIYNQQKKKKQEEKERSMIQKVYQFKLKRMKH